MASVNNNASSEVPVGTGKKQIRGDLLLLSDSTNVPPGSKRASSTTGDHKIKRKWNAPRGRHVSMSPPPVSTPAASTQLAVTTPVQLDTLAVSPPAVSPPVVCPPVQLDPSSLPAASDPVPPLPLDTLRHLVREHPHVIEEGKNKLQGCTERNTTFATQKATTLHVFGACVHNGMGILQSSKIAATSMGFSCEVVRRWAKEIYVDFFATLTSLEDVTDEVLQQELQSDRGKHPKWVSLISDENVKAAVKSFIHENGYVKGRPNLTLMDVVSWVKAAYDVEVSKSSVGEWLHCLGFSYVQHTKGVYFDGHERVDVVATRQAYLETLEIHDKQTWLYNSPCPDPAMRPIIRVYHDESTYYSNADQSFHWSDGTRQVLKKKSLGQSIMVSDFVEEVGGMLEVDEEKATLLLEPHRDGYFTNDMLITQV